MHANSAPSRVTSAPPWEDCVWKLMSPEMVLVPARHGVCSISINARAPMVERDLGIQAGK